MSGARPQRRELNNRDTLSSESKDQEKEFLAVQFC